MLKEISEDLEKFKKLVALQNEFYLKNNSKLLEFLKKKFPKENEKDLEKIAKEDARYSLGLATETQLGCSYSGQTLELAIIELRYGDLLEEREFSKILFESIKNVAPSLIQLTDKEIFKQINPGKELKEDNFKYTRKNLRAILQKAIEKAVQDRCERLLEPTTWKDEGVTLVEGYGGRRDIDTDILAALIHSNSLVSIEKVYKVARSMRERLHLAKEFILDCLNYLSEYDKVPREFEVCGLIFELIGSASWFAQLKRHRMNTLLAQDYNPELGYAIPPNIKEANLESELRKVCDESTKLYNKFKPKYGKAAEYCLTNAHKRRVILATNLRQFYHISKIREDKNAQWEIRSTVNKMHRLVKFVAPATSQLLGGKHEFNEIRKSIYKE